MSDDEELDESDEPREETPELSAEEQAAQLEEQLAEERSYFNVTRSLSAGMLFALPLLAIYEIGVLVSGADINAAAEAVKAPISWLQRHPIQLFGADATLLLNSLLIILALIAVWRVSRLGALRLDVFLGMFGESLLYAMLLGPLALAPLTGELKFMGFTPHADNFILKIFVSAGAGFYEEAFFRLIILGIVFYLAKELAELRPFAAGTIALVFSGALFSAAHFLSPGQPADFGAFMFRLSAGVFLGLVFLLRGFGIAAWTHALFDLYVLCFG